MSRQVDKKNTEIPNLLDKVLEIISIRQVEFALECKISPGTLSKALERMSFSEDIVDKIYDRYKVRKDFWVDGKDPIFDEKSISHDKLSDNKEDPSTIYKNIVEGNTEYILIPRSVLEEKYRLVSIEQLARQDKMIEALFEFQKTLINKIAGLQTNFTGVEKAQ